MNIQFQPMPSNPLFDNLSGKVFGRLTISHYLGTNKHNSSIWFCVCECGNTHSTVANSLKRGRVTSCGCLRRQVGGGSRSPECRIYGYAKDRCTNPNVSSYRYYGGRGIEFRFTSFKEFLDDVGLRPSPSHSLERKDSNGHYEKGNVKWATFFEQMRNRRNNKQSWCSVCISNPQRGFRCGHQ